MAYVKTVWETGDVITANKLNNMEGGIEAANDQLFVITVTWAEDFSSATLDKALSDFPSNTKPVVIASPGQTFFAYGPHFDDQTQLDGLVLFAVDGFTAPDQLSVAKYDFVDVDGVLTWTDK